jgi:hypothetical protein
MWKVAYELIKDYGAFGVGLIQLGIIYYFGWKLFTNHLKHIQDQVVSNGRKISGVSGKLTKTNREVGKLSERVAKIEGRCSAMHNKGDK